ncbi:MAG: hypothetical protein N3A63_05455 [Bacteroidetes bacterium]|nr:hypothetical protein [Bacteroidota bacterium]
MDIHRVSMTLHNVNQGQPNVQSKKVISALTVENKQINEVVKDNESVLNAEEHKFFEQLFPEAVHDLRSYHAYKRDGTRSTFTTGTLIDRKG